MKCSADLKGKRASRVSFFLAWLWCLGLGWGLPLSVWADDADLGRDLYHELCAGCHGKDMLKPGLAFDLKTFPANDYSRFEKSVLQGKGNGMPAWLSQLNVDDVRLLWAYVRSGG
jgi:mono/diheme cytochrome c family protein